MKVEKPHKKFHRYTRNTNTMKINKGLLKQMIAEEMAKFNTMSEQEEEQGQEQPQQFGKLGYDPKADGKVRAAQLLKSFSGNDFCGEIGCPEALGTVRANMPQVATGAGSEADFEKNLEAPPGQGLETNEPDKIPDMGAATKAYLDSSDDSGTYPQGDQVNVEEKSGVNPDKLKPTQKDIYMDNAVGKLIAAEDPAVDWKPWKGSVLASNDGYILDGHHRWAAVRLYNQRRNQGIPLADGSKGKPEAMTIMRVDMPIQQLLKVANAYTDAVGGKRHSGGGTVAESKKDMLKRIVAEEIAKIEIETIQKEGFFSRWGAKFGRANKDFPKYYDEFKTALDDTAEKMNYGRLSSSGLLDVVDVVYDAYGKYKKGMMAATGEDTYGWTQELNKDQQEQHDEQVGRMRRIIEKLYKKAEEQGNQEAADKARELERQRYRDMEREREEREARQRERERSSSSSSSKKSEFDKWYSDEGDNYNYMTRMESLSKQKLAKVVQEVLADMKK